MISKQEVLNVIAVKHGFQGWGVACFKSTDKKIDEMRREADKLYDEMTESNMITNRENGRKGS